MNHSKNEQLLARKAAATPRGVGVMAPFFAERAQGEVAGCFRRPDGGKTGNRLVTDADGRVFEAKTYSEGGVLDIVLDEVTSAESVSRELTRFSGTPVDSLSEEELRTARQPERRYMTISHSTLAGLSHLADHLAPMEMRLMLNSYIEEAADAILEVGSTVDHSSGQTVVGLHGAPRYFADHAFRALRAACEQLEKTAALRASFSRQGKEMPPMSCGIWTGEVFIGTLGSSRSLSYTAIGQPVDLAGELARYARAGEILLCEFTVRNLIKCLPEGWEAVRADRESDPDLSDFHWSGDAVTGLPEELSRGVWLFGPGVAADASRVEFYLDYLWALKVSGHDEPVPILRAVRPAGVGTALELGENNIVTTQFAQNLGKYRLHCVLGTGGMGKVWKAQDRFGNIVAIKVLHTSEQASESQLKRFRREAEIMARLPHRNICRVFEMNEFEDIHFLVMEFIDGLTLADLLYEPATASGGAAEPPDLRSLILSLRSAKSSRSSTGDAEDAETSSPRPLTTRILPVEQTLSMFLKICDAVQFAHEHGVLHRDLKPGNILLREDGEPLVADFGLAKLDAGQSGRSLSVTGNVVGTLENMSPEQAESSKNVDERADVYGLGTILFQMLTGRRHFEATGNIVSDAQALQTHEPPRPRSINPALDPDLEVILLKALRNSPAERYRTVAALKADIEHYRHGEPISARPISAVDLVRKLILRNRAVSAVSAVFLLILMAGSVAAFWKITDRAEAAEKAQNRAEAALKETETQREAARRSELLAQEQKREAEQRRLEAERALEQVKVARAAEQEAHRLAQGARQETEAEREARQRADAALKEAESRARTSEEKIALLEQQNSPPPEPVAPPAPQTPALSRQDAEAARQAMMAALQTFQVQLSPGELFRFERNPDAVLSRIDSGFRDVSKAIQSDPTLPAAWTLKGRYHLMLMEIAHAKKAFEMSGQAAEQRRANGQPDHFGGDRVEPLIALCDELEKPSNDRYASAAASLSSAGGYPNEITSGVLRFLADKPVVRRATLGPYPTGRKPGLQELAADIIAANGGMGFAKAGSGTLEITGFADLRDLSPLRQAQGGLTTIAISGAQTLDWPSLSGLPLEEVDLSGCRIPAIPPDFRGFSRVRRLDIAGLPIEDVLFLRWMPLLEELDLSDTLVTDLSPLAASRRLRVLSLGGLSVSNMRCLVSLPLERLTLSPLRIVDKIGLNALRGHRTLKVLRTPGDPEDQPAAEFWRRLDAGDYATSG